MHQFEGMEKGHHLKQVASASNPLHARLLVGILEDQGIEAIIQGENLFYTRGELPFTPDSAPSVWVVQDDQAPRAMDLLARHDGGVNPAKCRQCGYELRGLTEARCPECGTPFRVSGEWTCAGCGETSPTQFTHCWSCGAAQEEGVMIAPHSPRTITRDEAERAGQPDPGCPYCNGTGLRSHYVIQGICVLVGMLLLIETVNRVSYLRIATLSLGPFVAACFTFAFASAFFYFGFKWGHWRCSCCESD